MLSLAVLCCFLFVVVVSENKFYLNKGLNTLHNIKTEEGEKNPKNQFTSQGIGQLLLVKLQALQLRD